MEDDISGQNKTTKIVRRPRRSRHPVADETSEPTDSTCTSSVFLSGSKTLPSSQKNKRIYNDRRGGRNGQNNVQMDQNKFMYQNDTSNSYSSSSTHQIARGSPAVRGRGRRNRSNYQGSLPTQIGPLTSDTHIVKNVDRLSDLFINLKMKVMNVPSVVK
uniref:Reverse transcriptase domain-containing protein n=1 Tax=Heterorhabditis bacteriophora TaxID=37862 RepID=A0A1I7XJA8_HETBA